MLLKSANVAKTCDKQKTNLRGELFGEKSFVVCVCDMCEVMQWMLGASFHHFPPYF